MDVLQLTPDLEVAHIGPPLEKGRQNAVIYFALSAQESLDLDPYNQPAVFLARQGIRVFSLNLPFHGPNLNAINAIDAWANAFNEGKDPLTPFIDQALFALNALIKKGLVFAEKIGFMGLSRGGLIASLVATQFPTVKAITAFAPMTELTFAKEFQSLQENKLIQSFNLINHVDTLYDKTIRFYIGNRDVRVGTDKCFHLTQLLAETAFQKGIRSPAIEMMMTPSIGHMGHGTSKEIFEAGARWIGKKLGTIR